MKTYLREILIKRLRADELFDANDASTVLNWLVANEGRRPVVVVGSGFSRNAVNSNGRAATDLPLWTDLTSAWERDLGFPEAGIPKGTYDALRLAEMHEERLGRCAFRTLLEQMIHDQELEPGEAHEALFSYPVKAVLTTNQLDTLLDKNANRWTTVVDDEDLSIHTVGDRPQLIYFHGHRSVFSSWVFTRGQYEDIETSKPRILTRVRQLLSQHPVLIIGYSLADPDFHNIYRQISLDMRNAHPRGLAILVGKPHEAERQHWEKLGIDLAVLNIGQARSEASARFAEFLSVCSPVLEEPIGQHKEIIALLKQRPTFAERLAFGKDVLLDERLEVIIRPPYYLTQDYDIWLEIVRNEFQEETWKNVMNGPRAHSLQEAAEKWPLTVFPTPRFSSWHLLDRICDEILGKYPKGWDSLAEWLEIPFLSYFENVTNPGSHSLFDVTRLANLLSWVRTQAAIESEETESRSRESAKLRAEKTIFTCWSTLRLYDEDASSVEADASRLGITLGAMSATPAFSQDDGPYLEKMGKGYESACGFDHKKARDHYDAAAKEARRLQRPLQEWLAVSSSFYHYRCTESAVAQATDSRYQEYLDRFVPPPVSWTHVCTTRPSCQRRARGALAAGCDSPFSRSATPRCRSRRRLSRRL